MATTEELTARLDALRTIRAGGVVSTTYDGERVEYRTDADLAAAIADIQRQLAATPATTLYFSTCKGL